MILIYLHPSSFFSNKHVVPVDFWELHGFFFPPRKRQETWCRTCVANHGRPPTKIFVIEVLFFSHKSTLFVPSCLFVCLVQTTYLFLVAGTFSIFWYACAVRSALLLDQRPKIFTSRTQPPTSQKQGPSVIMNIYLAKCYVVSNVLPTCTWKICSVSSTWIVRVSSTWMLHLNLIRST